MRNNARRIVNDAGKSALVLLAAGVLPLIRFGRLPEWETRTSPAECAGL